MLIQEKAKSLFEDLKKKHGKESDSTSFNDSHSPGGTSGKKQKQKQKNHLPTQEIKENVGSVPGLGRSLGGVHGNQLQYSCLENPTDKGNWLV